MDHRRVREVAQRLKGEGLIERVEELEIALAGVGLSRAEEAERIIEWGRRHPGDALEVVDQLLCGALLALSGEGGALLLERARSSVADARRLR